MKKLILIILLVFLNASITAARGNIDSKIHEGENYIEYAWRLAPGVDIDSIRFEKKNTDLDRWVYHTPEAFQVIEGKRMAVDVRIIKKGKNQYGFKIKNYNKDAELNICLDAERCANASLPMMDSEVAQPSSNGTTYYVRTDGGTATQCTGLVDAPYPGSGTNQPCAWSHPFWALNSSGNWKIQGGDTLIIAAGSYMMGYGAPNTSGWCDVDYTYECDLPPLPAGPDANHPTRILGKGWNSGCPNPPELWGTQRPWQILDLTGSSNVYIGCLEITDHSNCVEDHASSSVECERDNYPYGNWASDGILASDASNVTLKHLDVHGLASAGIRAGRISNWTIEDVRIAGNGWVGWEGDLGDGNSSNSGTIMFNRVTIEWNGCGETYPGKQPHNCWAQTAGGYGDGLGTGTTGGHWIFQDCIFRYNTSDGLDLLYARESGSKIDIKRTQAYGNAGNAVKVNGDSAIENCLLVGNCGFFNGKSFTYHVDNCRALGSTLVFSLRKGNTFSVVNSTIAGHGDCLLGGECDDASCNGSETIVVQNNIFQGYPEFENSWDRSCYFWLDQFNFYNTQMDYNIVYDAKIADEVHLSAHDIQQDPLLVNDSLDTFNGHLQPGSPAIDSGLVVGSLNGLVPADDIDGNNRPAGSGVDRGAYEYGSSGGGGGGGQESPFGSFDTPKDGATVYSSIPVTGWALDDVEVESVKIYRDPVSGHETGMIYIGDAVFVEGARPDIEAAYPDYPNNSRAGWGYMMLTNFLPNGGNGTFTIYAIAKDGSGNQVTLGTKTITCDNAHAVKPFGAIDTPTQGGTAWGSSFINWGWVLTPPPNSIPTNGSTINVILDGVTIGHPIYNIYRPDIASLFPGYANSNGAVGYFYLDTTAYKDGVHTIQWTASDSAGNTDGIGSRYFTIQNTGKSRTEGTAHSAARKAGRSPIRIRKGYNKNSKPQMVYPDENGTIYIEIKELERLEIHFSDPGAPTLNLSSLPIGSTLDRERGVFYWQPGPGFIGEYPLIFMRKSKNGKMTKKTIIIKITPRY
ncbi:MAG: hypothetical protein GTO45_40705 [Candidatus Aminicenantes bacterium]|nr:hypothetical protein [Candidatus Aminicenantes bacterium]NIM84925.1 hypothetical protein [Candidatus Aminicenantes bacterium]NIN24439.1 hypothetical protein [Candidatus Aminicenantes bacterium]NIN48203.1 hypothetical protein [Candidatus Aminicenantes bacterium]NIN91106.1 hypothetical protein [Candidatus Aminicenantes bacterium]